MKNKEILKKAIEQAQKNGYREVLPGDFENPVLWYYILFSHKFARAFWGDDDYLVGNRRTKYVKEYIHHLQAMATYENPLKYIEKFFIELPHYEFDNFLFGKDIFLKTDYPYAKDSRDNWSAPEENFIFHFKPVSLVSDFWSGANFAEALLKKFSGKKTLLDLGTATGSVPLTMRLAGLDAVGLEGLPVQSYELKSYMMKDPYWFAWEVAPEIVETCDITQPFRIEDTKGEIKKFDYIISTDCFEHLVTQRIPILMENIYNHLADDGYGIFEINMVQWMGIHQTCKRERWWHNRFKKGYFEICKDLTNMDFEYVRSKRVKGDLIYRDSGEIDPGKFLIWVKKKVKSGKT